MNFYNISQVPQRHLSALHYHSSLEEPTLQNVEARLEASRAKNKEMGRMFFQQKFGSKLAYDSYIASKELTGLIHQPLQQPDFKTKLQMKAMEIQKSQINKIKNKQGKAEFREDNPWTKTSTKHPQQQKSETQSNQMIKSNPKSILKPEESLYLSGFQKYLENKKYFRNVSPKNNNSTFSPQKNISNISGNKIDSPKKQKQLQFPLKQQSKISQSNQKFYEQQLVKKIFKQISGHFPKKNQSLQKIKLIQYFTTHSRILQVLGVTLQQMMDKLFQLSDMLDSNDILIIIFDCLNKKKEMRMIAARKENSRIPNGCLLQLETIKKFEAIFKHLDKHSDLIVKRIQLIASIAAHPQIKSILNEQAVFESAADRSVSLRRIFQRIEIQALLGAEPKTLQYISWQQFLKYFESGRKERGNYDLALLVQSLKKQQKFGLSQLPSQVERIIKDALKKVDKGEELLSNLEIIDEIKMHAQYSSQKYTYVRSSEEMPSQSLEEVLKRIKETGNKYLHTKQFLEYFSTKGKPKEEDLKKIQKKNIQKKQQNIFLNQQPDGYDSDPEGYHKRKKQISFKQSYHPQPILQNTGLNYAGKITIPVPFSFQDRHKTKRTKSKEDIRTVEERQFKARPIPKRVADVGLYTRMIEDDKKRIAQRKKTQMIMSLALEQPFSFENRKVKKKTKQQRQQYQFKAKPIPWYCAVDLLKRKEQQNIARNEKIARMAQEKLAQSKLPPRMQQDQQKRQNKALQIQMPRPKSMQKVRDPPNFQRIHKQLQQQLERKRKQNFTTQIQQFKLSKKRPTTQSDFNKSVGKIQNKTFYNTNKSTHIAKSTAKYDQQVYLRKKQLQEKRLKQIEKQKQEATRAIIDPQLKKKVQNSLPPENSINQKERKQMRAIENRKQNQTFKSWKQQCIAKAKKQPLLVDRPSKRDQRKQLKKRLYEISKTLRDNHIKGKDHDKYFKKQELLLLKEEQQERKFNEMEQRKKQ